MSSQADSPESARPSAELSAEDAKIVLLAKGARARVNAQRGAAVRDDTGRTYSSSDVALPGLAVSAVVLVVATAAASGARALEAVACVGGALTPEDRSAVAALGGAPVLVCDVDGAVLSNEVVE